MEYIYRISSRHPNSTHATKEWRNQAIGDILCSSCRCIKRELFPRPVDIVLEKGEYDRNDIFGGVDKVGVSYYHQELIRQIFDYMKGFAFGKCYDESGMLIPELVTVYSNEYIIPRGKQDSEYNLCNTCGMIKAYLISGKGYVLQNQVKDRKVFGDARGVIFITPEIASQLDLSQWKYAELDKVLIRDKPIDGRKFPGDPE